MSTLRYPVTERIGSGDSFFKIRILEKTNSSSADFTQSGGSLQNNNPTSLSRSNSGGAKVTVLLPLPIGINDSNQVSWGESSLNRLEQGGASVVQDIVSAFTLGNFDKAKQDFQKLQGQFTAAGEKVLDPDIAAAIQSEITTSILQLGNSNLQRGDLLSRSTGQVINSYQELIFKGVKLRSFDYSFQFTPRGREEGRAVKQIIHTFKKSMAAKTSASGSDGWFISAPDVFELDFMKGGAKHPFLYSHRLCALTSINVNYNDATPNNFSAYDDGVPVSTQMNLTFQELDPIYFEDYDDFSADDLSNGVGY